MSAIFAAQDQLTVTILHIPSHPAGLLQWSCFTQQKSVRLQTIELHSVEFAGLLFTVLLNLEA